MIISPGAMRKRRPSSGSAITASRVKRAKISIRSSRSLQLAEERQRPLVRRRDPADREPAILARQRAARRLERRAAHVDRDVARRLVDPGVEQMAGLRRATRAELDEHGRADDAPDLARMVREQRRLRPRRVVLRLLGDALEELAAARVVEIATV